jgi:hypothetical protein
VRGGAIRTVIVPAARQRAPQGTTYTQNAKKPTE